MIKMTIKDLLVDHPFYCYNGNYYSAGAHQTFKTWNDFWTVYGNADNDYNLIFRWDILDDDHGKYRMELFCMQQRKGKFVPIMIETIVEDDVKQIVKYLQKCKQHLLELWEPII